MEIYQPAEDSYFFAQFLEKYLKKNKVNSCLDLGTGSGILAEKIGEIIGFENVLASDINPEAISNLKLKKFTVIESNLFEKISGKFDLIVFNAPYLPFDSREPESSQVATTGGETGDEISLEFLKQATKHLDKNGKILLLISSLTPLERIRKFGMRIVARKKIFMEELLILESGLD